MKKLNKGFTVIELFIIIAVLGILAAIAIPSYQAYLKGENVMHTSYMNTCLQEAELSVEDCKNNADYLYPPEKESTISKSNNGDTVSPTFK